MNGLLEDLFATVTRDAGVPLRRLTQAERAEIVARLYEQGMFELRGAVLAGERIPVYKKRQSRGGRKKHLPLTREAAKLIF